MLICWYVDMLLIEVLMVIEMLMLIQVLMLMEGIDVD